jgi:FtsZ-binding cell division protein ZapB
LRAALDRIDRLKVEIELRDERINKLQRQTQIVAASDALARKRAAARAPEPVAATEPVVVAGGAAGALVEKLRGEVANLKERLNLSQETALVRGKEKRRAEVALETALEDKAALSRKLTAIRRALARDSGLAEARGIVDKILGAAMLETVGGAR